MIILLKQLLSYYKIFFSHHPPVFALFLFYEKKTCTKRKVGRGTEPALSARTNRSRAPTTSSRADLAPPSTPIGFARQPSCIPTYMYSRTARILNRALYCSASHIITVSLSESNCILVPHKKSAAEILPRLCKKLLGRPGGTFHEKSPRIKHYFFLAAFFSALRRFFSSFAARRFAFSSFRSPR